MPWVKEDKEREKRFDFEVVVDTYDSEERAMGWYYYLTGQCEFPFRARCIAERSISPLHVDEEVEVVGAGPERECEKELFVAIQWNERKLVVPLSQLTAVDADSETERVVEDWQYWVQREYEY